MKRLLVDFDAFKYTAASIAEKRSITVTQLKTGRKRDFDNRQQFKTFLAENNVVYNPEKWEIKDNIFPLSFDIAKNYINNSMNKIINDFGKCKIEGYIGKGDSFRVGLSTVLKYKGNRDGLIKPVYLQPVVKYMQEKYNCEVVTGIEVDDRVVIEATADKDAIIIGEDKDYRGCQVNFYDFNNEVLHTPSGLGHLELTNTKAGNKKYIGNGVLMFYFQVLSGDASDNYKANSASDLKWGDAAAYKALKDCKTVREAYETVVSCYKKLYPALKKVPHWNGDKNSELSVDWKYMLEENISMAYLLRRENEINGITKEEYHEKFKAGGY